MVETKSDYPADEVEAAKSVLIELVHLLGEYRDDMVVIGGWVPPLLFPEMAVTHVGSTDIDLALNHTKLPSSGYRRISQLLEDRGYVVDEGNPYVWRRKVDVDGKPFDVEVDFLAAEYGGTGGRLPGGARDSVVVRVAAVVPFVVMKASAMKGRLKAKDAYDIYWCLPNYPGGVDALVEEFRPHVGHGLVGEALDSLAGQFASTEHVGPRSVADFEEIADQAERARVQRDSYERVRHLLERLGRDGSRP